MKRKRNPVRVGIISRMDYFSQGYRGGLVKAALTDIFEKNEQTHFNVLLGGLISKSALKERLKEEIDILKKEGKKVSLAEKKEIKERLLLDAARYLADVIPIRRKKPDGKGFVKLYLMVSPPFDGEEGRFVAERLDSLREDIIFFSRAAEEFSTQDEPEIFKYLGCLVPETLPPFRSKYYSTPADAVLREFENSTRRFRAEITAIGCLGSFFLNPRYPKKRPYFTVPNISAIGKRRTSENQVGAVVIELPAYGRDVLVRNYSLNDLVVNERTSVKISDTCSENQRKIMEAVRERGDFEMTRGELARVTGLKRDVVAKEVKKLLAMTRIKPRLITDSTGHRYGFPPEYIQRELSYNIPNENLREHRIFSFGCLHALSVHTQHKQFIQKLPELILARDADILVGAGDFIEGRFHGLPEKGEIIAGANYTQQEKMAGQAVGEVILRVFEERFKKLTREFSSRKKRKALKREQVEQLVRDALILFLYISGNHDDWVSRVAIVPLEKFSTELSSFLRNGIEEILLRGGYSLPRLGKVIREKTLYLKNKVHTLESGIDLLVHHLYMGRALTVTLRSQALMESHTETIVIHANFHTEVGMTSCDPKIGQRVAIQLGTYLSGTEFEGNKGKKVDFGPNFLRFTFDKSTKRIFMVEMSFPGADIETSEDFSNDKLLEELSEKSSASESLSINKEAVKLTCRHCANAKSRLAGFFLF